VPIDIIMEQRSERRSCAMSGRGRIGKSDWLAIAKQLGAGSGGSVRDEPREVCLADRFGLVGDGFLSEQLFPRGLPTRKPQAQRPPP
jgi:hypothetical protein